MVRKESLTELGTSSWLRIKEAIQEMYLENALDLVDYLQPEGKRPRDQMCNWVYPSLRTKGLFER